MGIQAFKSVARQPRADYDASTADVLGRRYGQARWGAQQAVEKTLKG